MVGSNNRGDDNNSLEREPSSSEVEARMAAFGISDSDAGDTGTLLAEPSAPERLSDLDQ